MKPKLLILGWDAADWEIIDDLLAKGQMPALAKVLKNGVRGKLATMDPPISPMLWTSIATGKTPEEHGILGFVEPMPDGSGLRPLNSTSRKVKAFWNILNQNNLKSNIVGWWPSHPAEPINGVMVSNFYQMIGNLDPSKWEMAPGTVFPDNLSQELKEFRVHPLEISPAHILPFIPNFFEINHKEEKPASQLRKELAHASSIQAVSTYLMQNSEWDVMAIYYDFIDHCSHIGMRYRPPKQSSVPEERFKWYKEIVDGAYRFQDMMLDRMLDLIDDNTSVMILSDHGFESGAMRPQMLPNEPAGPTHEHSPFGIFVWSGPGIKKNEKVFGSALLDIAPTILSYFNLPIGKDMKGNPILSAYENPPELRYIDSWENEHHGESGMHSDEQRINAWNAKEALDQLIELGYIEKPDDNVEKAVLATKKETDYYLARSHIFNREYEKAKVLLTNLVSLDPQIYRYKILLAECFLSLKDYEKCLSITDELISWNKVWVSAYAHFLAGRAYFSMLKGRMAEKQFKASLSLIPDSTEVEFQLGSLYLAMNKFAAAIEQFDSVLAKDKRHVFALFGRAKAMYEQQRYEEAIDELLEIIELRFLYYPAHLYLGESLLAINDKENAINAFETALKLAPKMIKPKQRLISIYATLPNFEQRLNELKNQITTDLPQPLFIITGLVESGAEEVYELLKPHFKQSTKIVQSNSAIRTDEFGQFNLDSLNNTIIYSDFASLMQLPINTPVKLMHVVSDWDRMLHAQLKLGDKSHRSDNKVFPTRLDELNKNQLIILHDWLKSRPEIDYFEYQFSFEENRDYDLLEDSLLFFNGQKQ